MSHTGINISRVVFEHEGFWKSATLLPLVPVADSSDIGLSYMETGHAKGYERLLIGERRANIDILL